MSSKKKRYAEPRTMTVIPVENVVPEYFMVDGSGREEGAQSCMAKRSVNVRQKAHEKRIRGEEYIRPKTGKTASARNCVKPRCNSVGCTRLGRKCSSFSEVRQAINKDFYATGSLQLQREDIVCFVQHEDIKQRTVKTHVSRRSTSLYYHLPKDDKSMPVWKLFLNTLNISEKTMRIALGKRQSTRGEKGKKYSYKRIRKGGMQFWSTSINFLK